MWYLEDKSLVLLFSDEAHALRIIANQREAAKDYPTKPSAQPILFVDDDRYHPWSPDAILAAESAVSSLQLTCKSIWLALPLGATLGD